MLRKSTKTFRSGWREPELSLEDKLKRAFQDLGFPDEGEAIRGVMRCFHCNTIWHRDVNAARNMGFLFRYLRYHELRRPLFFQRLKKKNVGVSNSVVVGVSNSAGVGGCI